MSDLLRQWVQLLESLGRTGPPVEELGRDLLRRWQEPHRHYHTETHLGTLLLALEGVVSPALHLAVWFHDAIYDTRSDRNEEASAELARESLAALGLAADLVAEVCRLVLLTKRHATTADDLVGQLLLDADLMLLGWPEAAYDAYAEAIRLEYAWVADDAYRRGRAAVLRKFLERERLFHTGRFGDEAQARRNLCREIAALEGAA